MAQIDFSLQNRIPDGNGKLLVGDLSPTDGSYTTEQQYLTWMKGKILYSGYLYNGDFYKESAHTNVISKVDGAIYVDLSDGTNLSLYYCDNTTYKPLTEEAQVQAIRTELQNGTLVPLKARQDQNGNVIDQTYETKAEASDLKSAITANSNRISNLEQEHGGYVTVNYRGTDAVPTGKAKYGLVENIVGKSRAWNQLVQDKTSATIGGVTYTIDNTNHTVTVVASTAISSNSTFSFYVDSFSNGFKGIVGHKYLLFGQPFSEGYFAFFNNGGFNDSWYSHTTPQGFIVTCTDSTIGSGFVLRVLSGNTINRTLSYPIIRDLTLIFPDLPSTDLVTSNIPNLVKLCPDLLKYDAYGYSLVDTVVEGVISKDSNDVTLDTLSLPQSVTLRSAGTGFEDILDVETGEITLKCAEYTITGNESFSFYPSSSASLGNHNGVTFPIPSALSGIRTVLDAVGINDIGLTLQYANNDMTIYVSPSNIVMINDAWTTEATFVQNITGKHLVFALVDPTTDSTTPLVNNTIKTEGGGTINTIQTQTPVIDNSMDVGYLAL